MDPLSHVVIGRALIAAVDDDTDRRRRGAGAAAVLGALAPDVDAIMVPFGWDIYLRAHEIGTHSVAGALLVGGASGLIVAALARVLVRTGRPDLRRFALAGIVGALSHVALDLVCGARIRLAWPFADGRVTLHNRDVKITRGGNVVPSRLPDRAALRALLATHFGFDLEEVGALHVPTIPEWS